MTLKEAQEIYYKERGYDDWFTCFIHENPLYEGQLCDEFAKFYAEQKCKEQRDICAKEMESNTPVDFEGYPSGSAPTGNILEAPLPNFD